ncbi:hypothetical protein ACJX0J_024731, partial [Zea mays]
IYMYMFITGLFISHMHFGGDVYVLQTSHQHPTLHEEHMHFGGDVYVMKELREQLLCFHLPESIDEEHPRIVSTWHANGRENFNSEFSYKDISLDQVQITWSHQLQFTYKASLTYIHGLS